MPGRMEFSTTPDGAAATALAMRINNQGEITMPKQPAFLARPSADGCNDNETGDNSIHTVVYGTEFFDIGSNFASNTTFTAPVAGKYVFHITHMAEGIGSGHTDMYINLITPSYTYAYYVNPYGVFTSTSGVTTFSRTVIADLAACNTAYVSIRVGPSGQAKTVDANVNSQFSGYLLA